MGGAARAPPLVHGKSRREREGSFLVGCRVDNPARDEPADTVHRAVRMDLRGPDKSPFGGGCNGAAKGPLPR